MSADPFNFGTPNQPPGPPGPPPGNGPGGDPSWNAPGNSPFGGSVPGNPLTAPSANPAPGASQMPGANQMPAPTPGSSGSASSQGSAPQGPFGQSGPPGQGGQAGQGGQFGQGGQVGQPAQQGSVFGAPVTTPVNLTAAKPPTWLLFAAGGLALVAGIVAILLNIPWVAIVCWFVAGPIAIGLLALFVVKDTFARSSGLYAAPSWVKPLHYIAIGLCLVCILAPALRIADWVGHL